MLVNVGEERQIKVGKVTMCIRDEMLDLVTADGQLMLSETWLV